MYKQKKKLKSFLNETEGFYSKSSTNTIIRALLEPVANSNPPSLIFSRIKNKEGVNSLFKRLEYCENVEIIDVTTPQTLIKDDYIDLEFIIYTSARYNFTVIWDYSDDTEKSLTKIFFKANSSTINSVFEILQSNLRHNYKEKFYSFRPERRENELLNAALNNVFKKLNDSIEENKYASDDNYFVDLSEDDFEEKIKEASHEIKNQISVLDVYTTILEKKFGKDNSIDIIRKTANSILKQISNLQNDDSINIQDIILQDTVEEVIKTFEGVLIQNENTIEFENLSGYDIRVFANEDKLKSVLSNILKNANESTGFDKIQIKLNTENNNAIIDITNHGKPINEQDKNFIFKKGFTTKRSGSGIGLYTCKNYMKEFKGDIELLISNKEETTFRLKLPWVN